MLITDKGLHKRFLSRVDLSDLSGCVEWSGSKDGKGYGTISSKRGSPPFKAHRVSWAIRNKKDPGSMCICHKCDNPGCVNPEHLFAGTQKDNMLDCSTKGRLNPLSLLNLKREKALTEDQVNEIKPIKFAAANGRGGVTKKSVAKKYGVCVDLITDISKGRY